MLVTVIPSDIANGRPRNEHFNPICLAVRRALADGEVEITLQKRIVAVDGLGQARLPDLAHDWSKRFNDGLAVEPINFSVEFPCSST